MGLLVESGNSHFDFATAQVSISPVLFDRAGFASTRQFDSDRREESLRRAGQNSRDFQTVLARRVDDQADDREFYRATQGPEASRDLRPQLHHSKSPVGLVVRERDG